jgi:uncharacterized membrane protein (UPF0127 family)
MSFNSAGCKKKIKNDLPQTAPAVQKKIKISNPKFVWFAGNLLFFALCVSFAAGCGPKKLAVSELRIERREGAEIILKAEMARTPEERSRGLMNRKSLADGEGMLFVFEKDEVVSFWMKNTFVPLSIAFIASDGRIIEIRDMRPNDLSSVYSSRSVRYALEAPQGWFSRAGIMPGDRIRF